MNDYISREAAQKIICGLCGVCQNPTLHDLMHCDDICPQFAQIPAADVRPVVKGGWEEHGEPNQHGKYEPWYYQCTRCGAVGHPEFNFCPNCGADMRPEEAGE